MFTLQPPSYSVAVGNQDTTGENNVQSVSESMTASGGESINISGDTCKDQKLLDGPFGPGGLFGPEIPEPPSYTAAVNEPLGGTPALHRTPPGQFQIPGTKEPFQPF